MVRRGRGQFQFTITELVVLAGSFTVTAVLVFLLGFYVGREVAGRHQAPGERVARIPVGAPPAETASEKLLAPERQPAEAAAAPVGPEAAPVVPAPARPALESEPRGDSGARAATAATAPAVPYTVQVLATRNRREAEALASDLKSKHVGAFVAPVEDASGRWYRVRIGRYDDLQSARAMEERCRTRLGLDQAYVVPYGTDTR